ncbi:MAG: ATP-binding cassette domain-containing protein [Deltaproteobacteria bacterium]|jgi:phospholipid/cholesterol/gamma-HCH transport system ATP-binding protein|nr:ATP-binding cassette domain-containing protein [Deltaproteobacteria bacterium]
MSSTGKTTPDAATPPPLETLGLVVAYEDDPPLLENLSFRAEAGEILGILGPSGCGKSSLLRRLVGLEIPRAGEVKLFGEEIFASPAALARARQKFGIMYQSGALFGDLNLLANVSLPLVEFSSMPPAAIEASATLKLDLVGLRGFERHLPSAISGGMRKRAAIARALALEPKLMFLDEPSAGLDPITAGDLDELIVTLARNLEITFVVITHELRSIHRIVDRAILLDRGARGIAAEGTPQFLALESPSPAAKAFFLRDA